MEWVVETDLAAYGERVLPWLARDPVLHSVPSTIVMTRLDGTLDAAGMWTAWLRDDAGEVAAIALRTPPLGVLMTALPPGAAAGLAAVAPADLPGAHAPAPHAGDFCRAYGPRAGRRGVLIRTSGLYRLDAVVPPPAVPGRLRPMAVAEAPLLLRWLDDFAAVAEGASERDLATCERTIRQGRRLLWEAGGEPVCLVGFNPPVAGVPRIGPVWTPPGHRRRGYAAAATAATCELLLDRGAPAVVLFADDANTTAVGVYTRLGFRPVAVQEDWRLEQ